MKRLLVALTVMASFTANATLSDSDLSYCKSVGNAARAIMDNRQWDEPMSTQLERAQQFPSQAKLLNAMISEAYEVHRWHTEDMQQREVAKFRNHWEGVCFKIRSEHDESKPRKVSSKE